jgi:branched-subunit amino acid transport protein
MFQAVGVRSITKNVRIHFHVTRCGICGLVADQVTLMQVFLQVLQFSPVSIILLALHIQVALLQVFLQVLQFSPVSIILLVLHIQVPLLQVFLQVLQFSPLSILLLVLHIHAVIRYRCHLNQTIKSVDK